MRPTPVLVKDELVIMMAGDRDLYNTVYDIR
jgi:hypothetical protein